MPGKQPCPLSPVDSGNEARAQAGPKVSTGAWAQVNSAQDGMETVMALRVGPVGLYSDPAPQPGFIIP